MVSYVLCGFVVVPCELRVSQLDCLIPLPATTSDQPKSQKLEEKIQSALRMVELLGCFLPVIEVHTRQCDVQICGATQRCPPVAAA